MNEEQDFQSDSKEPSDAVEGTTVATEATIPPPTPASDSAPADASPAAELPSVGRIVRYVLPVGSRHNYLDRAALVADVEPGQDVVTLSVFKAHPRDLIDARSEDQSPVNGCTAGWDEKSAIGLVESVPYNPSEVPGSWHWPKR